jgi:hypothetical protein
MVMVPSQTQGIAFFYIARELNTDAVLVAKNIEFFPFS